MSRPAAPRRLDPDRSMLLLIDWQERLFPAMPEDLREATLERVRTLRWLAAELGVPTLFTEQYPRGLGHTLPALEPVGAVEKTSFSVMGEPAFAAVLAAHPDRDQLVLTGMETHICVAQSAADLLQSGRAVTLVADGVLSRRKLDWRLGVERVRDAGASISTQEGVAFEWLGRAGSPAFKELSRRIR